MGVSFWQAEVIETYQIKSKYLKFLKNLESFNFFIQNNL